MSKLTTLLSDGVHEVEEAELALTFLYRLDKGRFGQMMVNLALPEDCDGHLRNDRQPSRVHVSVSIKQRHAYSIYVV